MNCAWKCDGAIRTGTSFPAINDHPDKGMASQLINPCQPWGFGLFQHPTGPSIQIGNRLQLYSERCSQCSSHQTSHQHVPEIMPAQCHSGAGRACGPEQDEGRPRRIPKLHHASNFPHPRGMATGKRILVHLCNDVHVLLMGVQWTWPAHHGLERGNANKIQPKRHVQQHPKSTFFGVVSHRWPARQSQWDPKQAMSAVFERNPHLTRHARLCVAKQRFRHLPIPVHQAHRTSCC
mmetsp:Transcript_3942/g.24881  ORF Transcript_3942/g.24881 Transcript_3942/m.24881 type:complete len:235 (+) Transcript_3942:667-1371(+)